MIRVTVIEPTGNEVAFDAQEGLSLMQAAVANDVQGIIAECGGSAVCATCQVRVSDAFAAKLPAPSEEEEEILREVPDRHPNSRLSCQVVLTSDLSGIEVRVPDIQGL